MVKNKSTMFLPIQPQNKKYFKKSNFDSSAVNGSSHSYLFAPSQKSLMESAIEYVEPSYVLFKRSQPVRQLQENAPAATRVTQKTTISSSFGASGSFRVSHSRQSRIFRTKISQSYVPKKKEISNKKDRNWHLRFCQSLQKSALKVIRWPNEKCTLAGTNFKKSSNVTITRKSGFHDCFGEPKQTYVKIAEPTAKIQSPKVTDHHSQAPSSPDLPPPSPDLPPAPPPRNSAIPALPPRSCAELPTPPPKTGVILPAPPPPSSAISPPLSQLPTFLGQGQPLQPHPDEGCITLLQQFYYSPSSGYYSCSNSVGSCSPLPGDPNIKKPLVIMPSVKSTQVEKPLLQTAIAVDNYIIRPPPAYRSSQVLASPGATPAPPVPPGPAHPLAHTLVPAGNPPSYSSIVQSLGAIQLTDLDPSKGCCIPKKPPLPLPQIRLTDVKPVVAKIDHHSPIPQRKSDTVKNVRKLRNYSPQEFKFFMEQRIENLIKLSEQRRHRRLRLEEEMQKVGLSAEAQDEMRKMLHQKESNYLRQRRAKMNKSMFERIKRIGVGAFGEVTLVCKVDSGQLYAMKTLRKADVLRQKQVAHVKAERDILAEADNEWVVKLYFSFQDVENLYFVMEYIPGGDLMSLLIKFDIFKEEVAKFYLAELTCAVESVHMMGFIHRDIKPDNILIDRDGHIKLTDFGLCTGFRWTHNSKYYEGDSHSRQDSLELTDEVNCYCPKVLERRRRREHRRCLAHSLVGTPNYIAPEVLLRSGYSQLCDWWSVGVVLYEMLIGCPPFAAQSPMETQNKIKNWQNSLTIPTEPKVSPAAIDLILKLCTSPEKRLGKNAAEIKSHPFLASIDFERGVRKLTPPYIPVIRYPMDTSNFDTCSQSDSDSSFETTSSSLYEDPTDKQSHGFFEFTFRRFFDDAGGVSFETKMAATPEATKTRAAIYV